MSSKHRKGFWVSFQFLIAAIGWIPAAHSANDLITHIPHGVCLRLIHLEELLDHMDPRISKQYPDLTDHENNGVCGPVCSYNLVRVIEEETQIKILRDKDPVKFIRQFEPYVKPGKSLSQGLPSEDIATALRAIFKEHRSSRKVELFQYSRETPLIDDVFTDPSNLYLVTIWDKRSQSGHMVIVKNIDRTRRVMHLLDPNYPTKILELYYDVVQIKNSAPRMSVQGAFANLYFGNKATPYISAVIQVAKTADPKEPFRIQNFWRRFR